MSNTQTDDEVQDLVITKKELPIYTSSQYSSLLTNTRSGFRQQHIYLGDTTTVLENHQDFNTEEFNEQDLIELGYVQLEDSQDRQLYYKPSGV